MLTKIKDKICVLFDVGNEKMPGIAMIRSLAGQEVAELVGELELQLDEAVGDMGMSGMMHASYLAWNQPVAVESGHVGPVQAE